MSQPIFIPYDSSGAVRFDVDPDGALHITLPAQGFGYFGIKSRGGRIFFIAFLLACAMAPLAVMAVLWWMHRSPEILSPLLGAAFATPMALGILGLLLATITQERVWIDATPAGMTIRRQIFKTPSQRFFPRDRIRALETMQDTEDMHWVVRLHGRLESEIILTNRSETDSRQIAARLRAVLDVPERPRQ